MTEAGPGAPDAPEPERAAPPSPGDRLVLPLFAAWTFLLLLGAYAQWTQNRFLLDLFDLRRWFTR